MFGKERKKKKEHTKKCQPMKIESQLREVLSPIKKALQEIKNILMLSQTLGSGSSQ